MRSEVPAACTSPYWVLPTRHTRFTWSQMFCSPSALTTSSSGRSRPFDCSAEQVIGWPCESSGGVPAASDCMILGSRSPQASASTSTFTPGCFASKRLAMFFTASCELGCVSVCQTRMTFCAWAAETASASASAATNAMGLISPPPLKESRSYFSRGNTGDRRRWRSRSEEHTSELQSHSDLVCRLLLEKKKKKKKKKKIKKKKKKTKK